MERQEGSRSSSPANITDLLRAHRAGDESAMEELAPLVYAELHQIAHRLLIRERPGRSLQTTGLVHEAFARLAGLERFEFADRTHFYALSARLMRQILTDYARRRMTLKHRSVHVPLGPDAMPAERGGSELAIEGLIDLDRALDELSRVSERQVRVIECRFYAGMTVEETAEALDVSRATVNRDWHLARAWLNRELA